MDSLDSLKKDIKSTKDLQSIISTMKAVASVNIKKYEKSALNLYRYRDNIDLGLQAILQKYPEMLKYIDYTENAFESSKQKQNITIVIGSNQGLCGRFNDKNVEFFVENELKNKDSNYVIVLGDRIESIVHSKGVNIDKKFSIPNSINNITNLVYDLFELIESKKSEIKKVLVYFTAYNSKNNGNLTKKKVFPLEKNYFEKLQQKTWPTNNVPFWRIDSKYLISDLIEQHIFCNLYLAISSSMAAEQRNRLITLQGAEENIKDHMAETVLKYNQTRQSVITSELIDVVTGARFLRKKKLINYEKNNIIVISGVTASGKSYLSLELAKNINGVVVNADAMQIYKGLPILSAQPSEDDKSVVEHRLYNIFEPTESNSVFKWLKLVETNVKEIFEEGKVPVVVGGSGMYISRLIKGIRELPDTNEELREELNKLYDEIGWDEFLKMVKNIDEESTVFLKKNDKHRIIKIYEVFKTSGKKLSEWEKLPNKNIFNSEDFIHVNLSPDRRILYERCEKRFKNMTDSVVEEVRNFIRNYDVFSGKKYSILGTIGLLEIKDYIEKKLTLEEAVAKAVKKTRNYAKQQYTWFNNQFKTLDFLIKEIPNKENINKLIRSIIK